MKDIVKFLLESQGADIKDRKYARFFGDELNKPRNVRTAITKTKKFLKDFTADIDDKIKDFVEKLAENREYSSDERSNITASFYEKYNVYYAEFRINFVSMPNSLINKLSAKSIKNKYKLTDPETNKRENYDSIYDPELSYRVYQTQFGNDCTLDIAFETRIDNDPNSMPNKELFFDVFNYVGQTLLPYSEDILNYYSEYHDKEAVTWKRY